ncbi:MAG: MHS family MFS transporter [Chloroflexi bacterium]|nr:MHS family MFS transporter [Chloroflexota bacterium]
MTIRIDATNSLVTREMMLPIISASTIGSIIQWFDFYLYSFLSVTVFPAVFFPNWDPFAGIIASFGASFVGFAARPLGAAFFGWFGDRIGRRSTLVATLLLMGIATMLVGILPGYATLGIAAPILLTLLRFLQGIGVGGEWGGATLLTLEYSDDRRRGFWTSWPQAGVPIGLMLAAVGILLFRSLYPGEAYLSLGWRMPFFLSPMLLLVGFYIRLRILETPLFEHVQATKQESKAPLLEALRYHWREVILCALLRSGDQAPFYLFTIFLLSYGVETVKLEPELLYTGLSIACVIEVLLMPVIGMVSDRLGRKFCYLIGCTGTACLALPYFWLLNTRNVGLVLLAIFLSLAVCHAILYAPQAALIAERFSTKVRYTGATLGFQLASVAAGGPAIIIATYLLTNQAKLAPGMPGYVLIAAYIIVMSIISVIAVLPLKEYAGAPAEA